MPFEGRILNVMVTGATGFVGRALGDQLVASGYRVIPAIRTPSGLPHEVAVGNINTDTDWRGALASCKVVIHLAARVHVMNDSVADPLALYREVNTAGTLTLARQSVRAGVKRFIYLSSIKVNGEGRDTPYRETDVPAPADAYAISKWEAEQGLMRIAQETGLEVVVLRPPLVYGPGVGANFLRLMQTIARGWPLPLGAIHNQRSLLYLGNLIEAIRLCIEHPNAAGQTFLLDDGAPVSSPELVRAIAAAMHRPARLLPVPSAWLTLVGRMVGKSEAILRLTGSLHVDSRAIREQLNWTPPYSMRDGLTETAAAFVKNNARGSPR